jgi:hypothetical protein
MDKKSLKTLAKCTRNPTLTNDIVEGNQETDYIKCEKGIVTK